MHHLSPASSCVENEYCGNCEFRESTSWLAHAELVAVLVATMPERGSRPDPFYVRKCLLYICIWNVILLQKPEKPMQQAQYCDILVLRSKHYSICVCRVACMVVGSTSCFCLCIVCYSASMQYNVALRAVLIVFHRVSLNLKMYQQR